MSPTYRLLSVTCDPTICAGTWVSVTYRLLSVTCDPTIFLQASEYYLCAGSWVLPRILLFIQAHECTYVQILECHLRFHYLYRHLNVTYIQALEYYLRSHYLYTHLTPLLIQASEWRFTPTLYTGALVSLYFQLTVLQKGVRRHYHENVTITLIPWNTTIFFIQRISAEPRYVLVRWNRWEIHLAHPMKYYYTFSE